mgnify:CR=1 FL=1
MNIIKIMTPKALTVFLHTGDTVRQGLELLRQHGYTAIPVLNDQGEYLGSITEGDFLRHILAVGTTDRKAHEKYRIGAFSARTSARRWYPGHSGSGGPGASAAELHPHRGRPELLLRDRHPALLHGLPGGADRSGGAGGIPGVKRKPLYRVVQRFFVSLIPITQRG